MEGEMAACEKCWGKAFTRSRVTGKSQAECYREILAETEKRGETCTPKEQAGDYWDEEKQIDIRSITP